MPALLQMNPERHQKIKQLFLAVCELDEQQAATFLDRECGDDRELRVEVESLLANHLSETIIGQPASANNIAETSPPPGTSSRTDTKREERFPPGTVLAGRYRIISCLGRGGMGEVYLADDLKLEQPVALKFLSRTRADDDAWLARFRHEVRLARKVTHANVNRVYDIGEAEGEVFFSMEYVDGEDLASLLRRVGRIAGAKATQMASQLCAGLGVAHDQGVLHRDLKPANIMIDGKGQVRITDFGIAAMVADADTSGSLAGTPAYMAPELFKGEQPSVQSDLYAMGIVLYELMTGKPPFDNLAPNHPDRPTTPTPPSDICADIGEGVQRIILQCLEADPALRPEAAYTVMVAMPGGDPLAAAIAAGKTPSPSLVAASGSRSGMRAGVAIACLGTALLGLLVVILLAGRTFFLTNAGLEKPPVVLADRAEEIIGQLGYTSRVPGRKQGFAIDTAYLEYRWAATKHKQTSDYYPMVFFWYRQGDTRLAPPAPLGEPSLVRKFPAEEGMRTVRLDGRGRLLRFSAVPTRSHGQPESKEKPDWPALFAAAELELDKFHSTEPSRGPPMFADQLFAWTGECPDNPEATLRVEGASLAGRVVYFDVVRPWEFGTVTASGAGTPSFMPSRTFVVRLLFYAAALAGGLTLAWRNVRSGRGDRKGAGRLAIFVLVLALVDWIVGEKHSPVFAVEAASAYLWIARAVLAAASTWIFYMALEVYVRRLWPQIMIAWMRLLKGRYRDPLVGRDLMIGVMLGIGTVLLLQFDSLLSSWLGASVPVLKMPGPGYDIGELLGLRYKLGTVVHILLGAITTGLVFLLIMLLLRVVVRLKWLAAVLFWLLLTAAFTSISAYDTFQPLLTNALLVAAIVLVLTRVGLLAVIVGQFVRMMIMSNPITADLGVWYSPAGVFAVVLVTALLLYGFRTALAGRPILSPRLLER
jgi:hypothetical protein